MYKRIRRQIAGPNLAFESAFGHISTVIPPIVAAPAATVALNEDEDVDFGIYLTGRDNDDNIDNKINDKNERDIWFSSPDLYDI